MKNVLLAGATGYLGGYILKELLNRNINTTVVVRNPAKLPPEISGNEHLNVMEAELTRPEQLRGCCRNMDVVISTVGITKQKDGLTYMDVDYGANLNLLNEARESSVKKFIYVSVLKGDELRHLKICDAKEKFVDALKSSGLDYCVIRPNGFFSDMGEFYEMAKKGRVYLFGSGRHKANPIHGADLAEVCVDAIGSREHEIPVGGPEVLTHGQIAQIAFQVAGTKPRITRIPGWVRKSILFLLHTFTGSKTYGPVEFFMTVLAMDLVAPTHGTHKLKEYFEKLKLKKSHE